MKKIRFYSRSVSLIFLFLCISFCQLLEANQQDSSLLTLDRIFIGQEFGTERFSGPQWIDNGTGYTTLELSQSVAGGRDIIRYNSATGKREILVSADKLIPAGESEPLAVQGYSWSKSMKKLLIFTNSRRVWRQNTRGDYWVLNRETGSLSQLGGRARPSFLMFAKLSPDGNRAAYVIQNNIFVENVDKGGQIQQLTYDGSETVINGTSDWTYEEEFGIRDGFRWSPDGHHIAFWQFDSSRVGEFTMINNTDSLYPKPITFRHAKVGTTNSACRIGVIDSSGGEPVWFDPSKINSRDHYIARMEWVDSGEIVFQWLNRLQNTNQVILGDIKSGEIRTVLTDTDEAWVDVQDITWIDSGRAFLWLSERDGWQHLYRVSRESGNPMLLTPGDFDVVNLESIDEKNGWVYFIACPENPTQRYLYKADLNGRGKAERVTPSGETGSHSYQISPDSRWAVHTQSSFGLPPQIQLIGFPGHKTVRPLADNSDLSEKLRGLRRGESEFFRVDIGDVELDGWMMLPPDFDPDKKYPLLFHVYGEPAGSTVRDSWGGRNYLWHLLLNQKGYIVASLDNRGTNVPRGRAWRKSVYRQVGILASQDQAAALRQMLKDRPYIDPDRIGIWGWSGGGSMSLNMIFRYPELYNTALAIAFVSNQLLYDTIYQERYMGLPDANEEGYTNGSPITHAAKLEGNLLIVHGTGDDNVHYQNFERMVNELVKHNKKFTMMAYPNRTHSISEGENTTRHLFSLLTDYLMTHMPPGPKLK
ncbi:MAG: S9 family peptidase [Candidatus Aminicenantes bacterium]|nr:S9 family peptidase [Candidatus Aminicenantes bacterium]